MGKLDNKVAIVTGAGSGMGRATARLFAAEGAHVICADVSGNQDSVAAEIGNKALGVQVDVSQAEEIKLMIAAATDTFGKLDVLVNNAGITGPHVPLDKTEDHEIDRLFAVNLRGVFLGMKYAIPAMRINGGGSIISTASVMGLVGRPDQAAYGATKGGVVALTKHAAVDHAKDNIRVNCICPGMVYTGLAGAGIEAEQAPAKETLPGGTLEFPMGRWGLAREIATAALFLAGDDSSFMTGVVMPVDGGYISE